MTMYTPRSKFRKVGRYVLGLAFVALLAWYGHYQAREFMRGPQITIASPGNGHMVDETFITLRGEAHNIAFLSLNGRQIYTDTEGRFSESLLLYPGYNIITIEATDAFNRTQTRQIEIVAPDQPDAFAHLLNPSPTSSSTPPTPAEGASAPTTESL